jgi:tRNA(fMet)-specific endonuclease VapC
MSQHRPTAFSRSLVSFHEQVLGAHTLIAQAQGQTKLLQGYLRQHEVWFDYDGTKVLPFDIAAMNRFSALTKQLPRVGRNDLRIAATALVHGLTVLTRNARDFGQVPNLAIDDWTK